MHKGFVEVSSSCNHTPANWHMFVKYLQWLYLCSTHLPHPFLNPVQNVVLYISVIITLIILLLLLYCKNNTFCINVILYRDRQFKVSKTIVCHSDSICFITAVQHSSWTGILINWCVGIFNHLDTFVLLHGIHLWTWLWSFDYRYDCYS